MARKCGKLAGLAPSVLSAISRCKKRSQMMNRKFEPFIKRKSTSTKKASKKKRVKSKPTKKVGGKSYSRIVATKDEFCSATSKQDVVRYEISKVVCWNYTDDKPERNEEAQELSKIAHDVKPKLSREPSRNSRASTSKISTSRRSRPRKNKTKERRRKRNESKSLLKRLTRFVHILSYIRSRTVENFHGNGDGELPSLDEMARIGKKVFDAETKQLNKSKRVKIKNRKQVVKRKIEESNQPNRKPLKKAKQSKSVVPVKMKANLKERKCQDLRRKIGPVPIVQVKPPNTEDEQVLQEFIVKNLKRDPLFLLKCVLKKDFSTNTMVQILTTLAMAGYKTAQKRRLKKFKKVEEIRIKNPQDPTTKSVNYLKEIKEKESFFKVFGTILNKIQKSGQERAMRFPNMSAYQSCEFRQIIESANNLSDCAIFVSSYRNRLDNDREIEIGSVLSVDLGRYSIPKREPYEEDSEDDDFQDALSRFEQD